MLVPRKGAKVADKSRTSLSHPIYVDYVPEEAGLPGKLGMTFAPGMKTPSINGRWERDLEADMRKLQEGGADTLVSLVEEHEYRDFGITELHEKDEVGGVEVLRFAIRDMGVPEEAQAEDFEAMILNIVGRLEAGRNVVVHCRGGLGRTGTVAACVLVALGEHSADEAIDAIRQARKGTIQTDEQEEFVRRFEQTLRKREEEASS
jgi:protein-tyrosine phosphatase